MGAGHNGLVAAAYLARAGLDVEVVERDTVIGGAVSTVERWPGVRVDRGSSIHVMFRHSGIAEDLRLGELGLEYDDVEPWGVLPAAEGAIRFSCDLADSCESIAQTCGAADADAYHRFVTGWIPRMRAFLDSGWRRATPLSFGRAMLPLGRRDGPSPADVAQLWLQPAEHLITRTFSDERLRAAVAWWAAQAGPPPHEVGTAPLAGTLALLHMTPAGRPRGGSGRLSETLNQRIRAEGGMIRVGDAATAIEPDAGHWAVRTGSGDRIATRTVVAACHAVTAARLLGDESAAGRIRAGNGVGMILRLLTDDLPHYPAQPPGIHTAMQLLVRDIGQLRSAYGAYLRGEPPTAPPLLVMTPTATDATLAPPGRHVVSVWTQWHPYHLTDGSWPQRRDEVADGILATLETWAPGFTAAVQDRFVQTPWDLEQELGLVHGNVMHVEETLDAMFWLRPTAGWTGNRTPYPGVYLCGASAHPGGGVWGASGRTVAQVVGRDLRSRRGVRPNRSQSGRFRTAP